jgi:predicted Ser/Thr protein kinase
VSPGQVFEELEDFVQRKNDYEFLRMEPTAGYHAHDDFVEIARDHYLSKADRHFKEALGLVEESQIPQMLARYATHLAALMRREKVLNEVTGQFEEPDQHMINRAEDMMGISKDREQFRRDVITNIAAWAHDHQGDKLDYTAIFPDFIQRIKNFYHEEHRKVVVRHLRLMLNQEEMRSTSKDLDTKLIQRSEQALRSMIDRHGYCESCAKEAASLLLKHRYAVN